jgi:hypothetical protein
LRAQAIAMPMGGAARVGRQTAAQTGSCCSNSCRLDWGRIVDEPQAPIGFGVAARGSRHRILHTLVALTTPQIRV